jgi:thiol-disulfide isomerase/thioredoxin
LPFAEIYAMTFLRPAITLIAIGMALVAAWPGRWATAGAGDPVPVATAPEFAGPEPWLNSPSLSSSELRGKVVLVEFWSRECINCVHVLPHTRALHDKFGKDGLLIVGVHTPEYEEERDPSGVKAAMREFDIDWPVVIDNDYRIWKAFGNRFWPALYLIDRDGRIVYRHYGEGNYDTTEQRVRQLLATH